MDASQEYIKYKSKMKKRAKSKPIAKSADTEYITSNISQLECEWFSRLCPNFTETRHIYEKKPN
jgi:hypothetical protein